MVAMPAEYRWSSFRQKTGLSSQDWLDIDPCFERSGDNMSRRQAAYRSSVMQGTDIEELCFIRQAVQRCQLTGNDRFIDEVEERYGQRLEFRGRGRPPGNVKV